VVAKPPALPSPSHSPHPEDPATTNSILIEKGNKSVTVKDESKTGENRRCGSCVHWKSGYCELRNQAVAPYSPLAETCPNFEPGEGPAEAKPPESKESVKPAPESIAVKTGTILDKLPSAIDIPKPKTTEIPKPPETPKEKSSVFEVGKWLYKLGFNVVPVNEEKRPLGQWATDKRMEEREFLVKLKNSSGIAVVGGVIHPFSKDYVLGMVDIDNPEALEKSSALQEIISETVAWKTGLRCPKCNGKHLDVVEDGKYSCKKCGNVFGKEEAKRGIGAFILVSYWDFHENLRGTQRRGDVEFLFNNYQLIPPSLHPHGIRYEWVSPLDSRKEYYGIRVVTGKELKEILAELGERKEERQPQGEVREGGKLRELNDSEILRVKELLKPVYKSGYRQHIWLYLSGWGAKAGISPVSVAKVLKMLYEETRDEDDIRTRGSALCYSYGKAGINLEAYSEALKGILGGEPYGLANSFNPESVKGYTGLQEVLEAILGEEQKALEVIRELEELFGVASPFKDSVVVLLDRAEQLFAVANLRRLKVVRMRRVKDGFIEKEVVIVGAPTQVVVYENPIGGITKYEVWWETDVRSKPIHIGPALLDDIVERLKTEGLVFHKSLVNDVLSAVLVGFIRKKKAIVKTELESPGFYLLDGKLVAVGFNVEKPSKEELREALLLLNELAEKWFARVIERFSFIIKWGVISPFIYAYKQREKPVRWLFPTGKSGTGKTTMGEIVLEIWGVNDTKHKKIGSNVDTEARIGYILSTGTFPVMINEPGAIFSKPELVEIIKGAQEGVVARGKYIRGVYTDIPALAPVIFTSNKFLPRDEAALRRLYILRFTQGEKVSEEAKREFNEKVKGRLGKLRALGNYIASKVLEEGLQDNPLEHAEKLLESAYTYAGLEKPLWIERGKEELFIKEGEIEEETIENIRNYLVKRINDEFTRHISKLQVTTESKAILTVAREDVSLPERIRAVLDTKLIPWMMRKNEDVLFTSAFIEELGNVIGDIGGLKSIAELLGWEYIVARVGKRCTKAIKTTIEELTEFLSPSDIHFERSN
jgi:hypothetical protein